MWHIKFIPSSTTKERESPLLPSTMITQHVFFVLFFNIDFLDQNSFFELRVLRLTGYLKIKTGYCVNNSASLKSFLFLPILLLQVVVMHLNADCRAVVLLVHSWLQSLSTPSYTVFQVKLICKQRLSQILQYHHPRQLCSENLMLKQPSF